MEASCASRHPRLILRGLLATLAVLTSLCLTRNIDFRVYWYGARSLFDPSRALYGPASGIGFPMHYRYPPATYLLFWPLSRAPLYWAGAIWMMLAWVAVIGAAVLAIRTARLRFTPVAVAASCGYVLAYAVLALRSGNVQPFLIAMIYASLLLAESHRVTAAVLLAVAITFKIWPLFFLPWFLPRTRRRVLLYLVPAILVLWLAPLMLWSPSQYSGLLRQWFCCEFRSATANCESWYFPGQSLRGVLLRYLTACGPWIEGYPDVHLFHLAPRTVVRAWEGIAAVVYAAVCIVMLRGDPGKRWVWDAVSFALFTLLEPFCLKSGMISLGPAILIAAACYSDGRSSRMARLLFLAACALSFAAGVAQYKPLLRLLLAVGIDFYVSVALCAALLLWARSGNRSRGLLLLST